MRAPHKMLAWRSALGLSQAEAAGRAGMSQSAWWAYEAGEQQPGVEQALRIATLTAGSEHHVTVEDWAESPSERAERVGRIEKRAAKAKRLKRKHHAA